MYQNGMNIPMYPVPAERFNHGNDGISPLTAGLIGAGLGFIGAQIFEQPGYGGYGPWYGGSGFTGYGPTYGPMFGGYGYNNVPGYYTGGGYPYYPNFY